ncbi:MAG: hypothetical protein K2W95_35110 [Candidatus Obscuribacterales bacterium]|nr:hypothetical protein [Candidatus Obscuribacterales bacterium]
MYFAVVRAALNAALAFDYSGDRLAACKVMQEKKPEPGDAESDSAAAADRILRTIVEQMKASAERFQTALETDQPAADVNKAMLLFRENMTVLFSIIRQLKGGRLPIAALYALEKMLP